MSKNTLIAKAITDLLAEAPARPAPPKVAVHPPGLFSLTVNRVFIKVDAEIKATEVLPGVHVEKGSPRIRLELTSDIGVVREDYTTWTSPEGNKVWLGLSTVLTSLGSAEITNAEGFAALIGKVATFTVRHEVIPAKDKFPARTISTIRPEKKAK